MNYKKTLANIFCVCLLIATSIVIVATSKLQPSKTDGTFLVQSDCVTLTLQERVSVEAGKVTTPGLSYTDFGFPQDSVNSTTVAGDIGGIERVCTVTYGIDSAEEWIYSCYDDGEFVCNIAFE